MRAVILEKPGGVENLLLREIEKPSIEGNEVLVQIKAISINPADVKIRNAEEGINMFFGNERPVILGWDISGTVVSIGDKVSRFKVGDEVFGMVNFPGKGKAYAEYVAAPENQLGLKPKNITFQEAAATTLAALTALQVFEGRIKSGDKVLIHAGSGGVGHFAIQIAKSIGAYVVSTSSAKNRDFVLSFGADDHIDYRSQAFEEEVSDMDLVLDGMGGEVLFKSLKVLKPGGTVICLPVNEFSDEILEEAKMRSVNVDSILVHSSGEDMEKLGSLLSSGKIRPHISKSFPFEKMTDAHKELESGRTVGKVVVVI